MRLAALGWTAEAAVPTLGIGFPFVVQPCLLHVQHQKSFALASWLQLLAMTREAGHSFFGRRSQGQSPSKADLLSGNSREPIGLESAS
jgi:hypothetical protein